MEEKKITDDMIIEKWNSIEKEIKELDERKNNLNEELQKMINGELETDVEKVKKITDKFMECELTSLAKKIDGQTIVNFFTIKELDSIYEIFRKLTVSISEELENNKELSIETKTKLEQIQDEVSKKKRPILGSFNLSLFNNSVTGAEIGG